MIVQPFSYVMWWFPGGVGMDPRETIARNYAPEIEHDLGYYHNDSIDSRYIGYLICATDNQALVDRCILSMAAWDARSLTKDEACALAERMAPPNSIQTDLTDGKTWYLGRAQIGGDGKVVQLLSDVPVDATPLAVVIVP